MGKNTILLFFVKKTQCLANDLKISSKFVGQFKLRWKMIMKTNTPMNGPACGVQVVVGLGELVVLGGDGDSFPVDLLHLQRGV